MSATGCEFDVTPEIELTPKTAFKLSYEHFMTCKQFDKAHALIERARTQNVINHDEWIAFLKDCCNRTDAYNDSRFGSDDEIRGLMSICTAPFTKD